MMEAKPMTIAEPGLSRQARWTLVGFLTVYSVLYFATWVGGYRSHAQQLKDQAESYYRGFEQQFQQEKDAARLFGDEAADFSHHHQYLHKNGPRSGVSWCVPVVPGLLLADSYYSVGPLCASGGSKLVFYYGFGSYEVGLLCWIT